MAVKYRLQVNSQKEQDWLVEIDFPTYDGEPIDLIGNENPIQIEYSSGSNDDPFSSHIIPQSATFQVYQDGIDLFELQTIPDADVRCRVYYNDRLKHSGFIISDGVQYADSGAPELISIKSIDGLELMDAVNYRIDNYGSITVGGRVSNLRCPMNIIRSCLYSINNLNNRLPIRWATSLKSEQYPQDDMLAGRERIAYDGKILQFVDRSVKWYLENILQTAQCWLYQRDGFWYIENRGDTIRNDGVMIGYQISVSTADQVADDLYVELFTPELSGQFINQDAFWMVKKPLGGVDITYNSTVNSDNVLPNGNMDTWSLGVLTDWGFRNRLGDSPSIMQYESLSEREGYAVQLSNDGSATQEAIFEMNYELPVDTWKLYKSMLFGFTFMPSRFGFPYDSQETINWNSNPLKISISFTYQNTEWYLNEFGFWQNTARGLGLGVNMTGVYRNNPISTGGNVTINNEIWFEGSPNIGDVLEIAIPNSLGSNPTRIAYTFTVTSLEENNLQLALDRLLDNIPTNVGGGNTIVNKAVSMQSQTVGHIRYRSNISLQQPTARTYKSNATQPFQFIYPTVDQLKIDDVATIVFSGKGGNSEILMPQIEGYDNINGRFQVSFYVKPGQQYVLDDVYMRLVSNNDLYKIRELSSKSPIESKEVGISSSFSGFMLSSYMNNFGDSNRSLRWTIGGNGQGKSLSELYGEFIMNWRRKPRRIFEGSIDRVVKMGDLILIKGIKYVVMNLSLTSDGISKVTAFEATLDSGTYNITHMGSNEQKTVNNERL